MKNRAMLLLVAAALLLSGCSAGVDAGPTTNVENGSIEQAVLEPGIRCDVYDTVQATGVDCDFSVLDGLDLATVEDQHRDLSLGDLVLSNLGDHVCVTIDGVKGGGVRCYYAQR